MVWESRFPGPLAPHADEFRSHVVRLGYSPGGTEFQMWVMAQLSKWLVAQGLDVTDLAPDRIEQFLVVQRARKGRRLATERALHPLFGYLRNQGIVLPPARPPSVTEADELLERYRQYLVKCQALAPRTVTHYVSTALVIMNEAGPNNRYPWITLGVKCTPVQSHKRKGSRQNE